MRGDPAVALRKAVWGAGRQAPRHRRRRCWCRRTRAARPAAAPVPFPVPTRPSTCSKRSRSRPPRSHRCCPRCSPRTARRRGSRPAADRGRGLRRRPRRARGRHRRSDRGVARSGRQADAPGRHAGRGGRHPRLVRGPVQERHGEGAAPGETRPRPRSGNRPVGTHSSHIATHGFFVPAPPGAPGRWSRSRMRGRSGRSSWAAAHPGLQSGAGSGRARTRCQAGAG